jgi:hypothetical protein
VTDKTLPVCEDHAHLPVRLEKIKEFYAEAGTLIREDIEYLLLQAEWAIRLDYAGEMLNKSSSALINVLTNGLTERDVEIDSLKDEISNLQNIIDTKEA